MPRFFSIFFGSRGTNQWIVLIALLFAGLAQSVSTVTLLPLLNAVNGTVESSDSPANAIVVGALETIGLSPSIGILLLIVFVFAVLKSGLVILAMTYVGYAVAQVATDLRVRLIDALLRVRWAYFVRQPLGSIANAISLEANRSANAYSMVALVLSYGIQACFYVAVAFLISWRVALVAMAVGALTAVLLSTFVRMAKRAGAKQTVRTRELLTHLSDILIGIKPLKAMNRHGRFADLFQRQTESLRKALRKQVIAKEVLRSLQEPLIIGCLAVGFFLSTRLWGVPVNELIVVGILLGQTVSSITKVQKQMQMAVIDESAYYAIDDMIREAEGEAEPRQAGRTPTLDRSCDLDGVSFAFGSKPVLENVSLTVPAGALTVITGASGAGKTTIVDLLMGLHEPQSGRVLIDGVPLTDVDIAAWRTMIGYVPQELVLFHDTVLHNVTLGDPRFTEDDARRALVAAGAGPFLAGLPAGLDTGVGERGLRLSGGERRRIALAPALVHKPRFVILDEVTSALDPDTEAAICANVRRLIADSAGAMTVLAITHRPAWLQDAALVYHLDGDGRVREGAAARPPSAAAV